MKQSQITESTLAGCRRVLLAALSVFLALPVLAQETGEALTVNSINSAAGASSVYQISFIARDTLFQDAAIAVTFPAEFDLSQLKIANSTTMSGGLTVSVQGNRALLQRSGLGRKIGPGERVELKFGLIKNPDNVEQSFSVGVESLDRSRTAMEARVSPLRFIKNDSNPE